MKKEKEIREIRAEINALAFKEFEVHGFEIEENNGRYFGILRLTGGLGNLTLSCPTKEFFSGGGFTLYHNGNVVLKATLITIKDVKLILRMVLNAVK